MSVDYGLDDYVSGAKSHGTKTLEIIRYKAKRDEGRWYVDGVPGNAQVVSVELGDGQMVVTTLVEKRTE